jgi:hypothetical protein
VLKANQENFLEAKKIVMKQPKNIIEWIADFLLSKNKNLTRCWKCEQWINITDKNCSRCDAPQKPHALDESVKS